ncbi:MAG: sulfatase family protein [Actinomycetota bacterium]
MKERLPNIILVVLDTARLDRFGCYGGPDHITPTVDSLAADGLKIDTMISNAPWTPPSHGSLFTGLYPSEHGCQWGAMRVRDSVPVTLAEWLRTLGYRTICATANGLISPPTGLVRGFDTFMYRDTLEGRWGRGRRRLKKLLVGGDSGGLALNRWLAGELRAVEEPFFLYVNYFEPHWAYVPPLGTIRRVGGPRFRPLEGFWFRLTIAHRVGPWEGLARSDARKRGIYKTLYSGEVSSADGFLGDLVSMLDRGGKLDGALLIATSDHGEHIGEHGLAEHQASLCDHLIRVPFVARGPGLVPAGSKSGPYEFVDVFPSLARLLGASVPEHLRGRRNDLFASDRDGTGNPHTFAEWRSWDRDGRERVARNNPSYDFSSLGRDLVCVRDDRFKLVRANDGQEWLFEVGNGLDEETDLAEEPLVLARLRSELDSALESWGANGAQTVDITDTERREIEQRLSDLGYI